MVRVARGVGVRQTTALLHTSAQEYRSVSPAHGGADGWWATYLAVVSVQRSTNIVSSISHQSKHPIISSTNPILFYFFMQFSV